MEAQKIKQAPKPHIVRIDDGGFSVSEVTEAFRKATNKEVQSFKNRHLPIADYDPIEKRAFLEYPDGRREY